MKKVDIFYDGTEYILRWLKPIIWSRQELLGLDINVVIHGAKSYRLTEITSRRDFCLDKFMRHFDKSNYDTVMLAFHPSHKGLASLNREELYTALKYIKTKCKCLVWLDVVDSTGRARFDILPFVDLYCKKQLLRNRELYKEHMYQARVYCDYYHKQFGLGEDEAERTKDDVLDFEYANKLCCSWNVGVEDLFTVSHVRKFLYPSRNPRIPFIAPNNQKEFDVHYRGSAWKSVAGYQRQLTMQMLQEQSNIRIPDVTTRVSPDEYRREIQNSKAVVSPFGWGEICTRDFEAFAYGLALIKPDMDHLETWPNWYQKNKTYLSLNWNFDNFNDIMKMFATIDGKEKLHQISLNGQAIYKEYSLDSRVGKMLFARHFCDMIRLAMERKNEI